VLQFEPSLAHVNLNSNVIITTAHTSQQIAMSTTTTTTPTQFTAMCTVHVDENGLIQILAPDVDNTPQAEVLALANKMLHASNVIYRMIHAEKLRMMACSTQRDNILGDANLEGVSNKVCTGCEHQLLNTHYKETIDMLREIALPSAQHKGIIGEQTVERVIREYVHTHPDAHVVNCTKDQKHASDLDVTYKNIRCCVEVKNIDKTLALSNVSTFRDVYMPTDKYNCGLFVSLRSSFGPSAGVKDFTIMHHDGKPAIYLAEAMINPWKITIALEVLNHLTGKSISDSEAYATMLTCAIQSQIHGLKQISTKMNAATKELTEAKKIVKAQLDAMVKCIQSPEI
jgi:hypothetical protein